MMGGLTKFELEALGLSCDPASGKIYLHGEEIVPCVNATPRGFSYPRIYVNDPTRLIQSRGRTKHAYGARPLTASRIVWAFAYGCTPSGKCVKAINGDPFDLRISNLKLVNRRKER